VLRQDDEASEEAMHDDDLLQELDQLGPIPLQQPVNVVVHSVETVIDTARTPQTSMFRIRERPSPNQKADSEAMECIVVLSEIEAYPGVLRCLCGVLCAMADSLLL
jgi:hypothetical protein